MDKNQLALVAVLGGIVVFIDQAQRLFRFQLHRSPLRRTGIHHKHQWRRSCCYSP